MSNESKAAAMEKLLGHMEKRVQKWPLCTDEAAWFGDNIRPVLSYIRSLQSSNKELEEKLKVAKEALKGIQLRMCEDCHAADDAQAALASL